MKKVKLLESVEWVCKPEYREVDESEVEDGYTCGCGGDDHNMQLDHAGCECYCHGWNE